jgi:transposase
VFFANKPVERLLRPGLTAEMLNDDSLGRALDRLYEAGLTDIFSQAASHALRLWDIHHRFVHLAPLARWRGEDAKPEKPEVVRITSTSSRAKRPNLKQV